MKKAILAAALFAAMGAQATTTVVTPDADFQWKGTIPGTIITDGGFFVVSADGSQLTNIGNGALSFTNIEGSIELDQSSSFDFRVVKNDVEGAPFDPTKAYDNVDFSVGLVSLESGREGFLSGQDDTNGYFAIEANDTRLETQGTAADYAAGELANLRVIKNPSLPTENTPSLNEINPEATAHTPWHVHARVVISAIEA